MTIGCNQWPMTELTVPKGSKRRVMKCHPQEAIPRTALGIDRKGRVVVKDPDAIKMPPGTYYGEAKLQGHRYVFSRDKTGKYHLHPRGLNVEGRYTDRIGQLHGRMHLPGLIKETACDCELFVPGKPDSYVSTAIADSPHELRLCIFAVPIFRGTWMGNLSYEDGRDLIQTGFERRYWRHWWECWEGPDYTPEAILEDALRMAKEEGEEGLVLKGAHYSDWWKVKLMHEADVFVTGFKISDAETRRGMVTAVEVGVYDSRGHVHQMGRVSGFDLDEMNAMTKAYNRYGARPKNPFYKKALRVVYQERAAQGKMKHGFFDCWREDKGALDCTREQFA